MNLGCKIDEGWLVIQNVKGITQKWTMVWKSWSNKGWTGVNLTIVYTAKLWNLHFMGKMVSQGAF